MVKVMNLTKKYGEKLAVDHVSFQVRPGVVTGFLGPNGAGKSTTIRMILNLTLPTAGQVTVDDKPYTTLRSPLKNIGAVVDANLIDRRLSPKQYLQILTTAGGSDPNKIDETLSLVGLTEVRNKKIGEFSLGLRQRVAIASALVGDPQTIILDEPFNGLDVNGIRWLRNILRDLAKQGKAVLISSHLLSEVQELADRIILLAQGELIADLSVSELQEKSFSSYVKVQTNDNLKLYQVLKEKGIQVEMEDDRELRIRKMSQKDIGDIAFEQDLRIYELMVHQPSLEQIFEELVGEKKDYCGQGLSLDGKELV